MNLEHFGPADLQKVWHGFFGQFLSNKDILDIGSGRGLIKKRMGVKNNVITHDVNRALMNQVDIIAPVDLIQGLWDIVSAYDVIEHVCYSPQKFMKEIYELADEALIITTPNHKQIPRDWHYTADEFLEIIQTVRYHQIKYFHRYKSSEEDYIKEVNIDVFKNKSSYALGIMGYV